MLVSCKIESQRTQPRKSLLLRSSRHSGTKERIQEEGSAWMEHFLSPYLESGAAGIAMETVGTLGRHDCVVGVGVLKHPI